MSNRYVMRCGLDGPYLKSYDPEASGGIGHVIWTTDPDRARRFESREEAMRLLQAIPRSRPLRPDGKPNRPLTAFTVSIEEAP